MTFNWCLWQAGREVRLWSRTISPQDGWGLQIWLRLVCCCCGVLACSAQRSKGTPRTDGSKALYKPNCAGSWVCLWFNSRKSYQRFFDACYWLCCKITTGWWIQGLFLWRNLVVERLKHVSITHPYEDGKPCLECKHHFIFEINELNDFNPRNTKKWVSKYRPKETKWDPNYNFP